MHLVDAHLCSDAAKYISALLLSLNVMLSLSLPHINLLSKIDLIQSYGELTFNLDYYTEVRKTVQQGQEDFIRSAVVRSLWKHI